MKRLVTSLALTLAGCVLFVSGDRYGDACRFAGSETQCGACVRETCQAALNACCADDACGATLADLDACAKGDPTGCKRLSVDQGAPASTRAALAACVTGTCRSVCKDTSAASLTRCTLPILGNGKTCHCELSAQPNDQPCDATRFPDTICCAPETWPAEGQRCSCQKFSCGGGSDCFCRLSEDTTLTLAECSGAHCCVQNQDCSCGAQPCGLNQREVPSCSLSFLDCGPGQKRVDDCTVSAAGR